MDVAERAAIERPRRLGERHRRALASYAAADLNFTPPEGGRFERADGWLLDEYRQRLAVEEPGPPDAGGAWERARSLVEGYAFVDPKVLRAYFDPATPLLGRTMLLEVRYRGLRFHLGARVATVIDQEVEVDGRRARVWGWGYHTLQGHIETGQMQFEAWKWLDDGAVEFQVHVASKPARIPNPLTRLGFRLVGRREQVRFARTACSRMLAFVSGSAAAPRGAR